MGAFVIINAEANRSYAMTLTEIICVILKKTTKKVIYKVFFFSKMLSNIQYPVREIQLNVVQKNIFPLHLKMWLSSKQF